MRILVLYGDQNQAVACVRSLARQGHVVRVGESRPWSKAGWSRYCSGSFQYASPHTDPQTFLSDIVTEAGKESGTLVLPMTEASTLLISDHRERLAEAGARLVLPSHADLMRAVDKSQTTNLAQSFGIAIPKSYSTSNAEEVREISGQMQFPAVLKPRTSQEHSSQGAMRATGRPRYARDANELMQAFLEMRHHCSAVLVQEFVEGSGTGYFALMNHGELRAEFAHRRIRDVHPTGSGSALRESIAPTPQIRDAAGLELARRSHDRISSGRGWCSRLSRDQRTVLAFLATGMLRRSRFPRPSGADGGIRRRRPSTLVQGRPEMSLASRRFPPSCGSLARPPAGIPRKFSSTSAHAFGRTYTKTGHAS